MFDCSHGLVTRGSRPGQNAKMPVQSGESQPTPEARTLNPFFGPTSYFQKFESLDLDIGFRFEIKIGFGIEIGLGFRFGIEIGLGSGSGSR